MNPHKNLSLAKGKCPAKDDAGTYFKFIVLKELEIKSRYRQSRPGKTG